MKHLHCLACILHAGAVLSFQFNSFHQSLTKHSTMPFRYENTPLNQKGRVLSATVNRPKAVQETDYPVNSTEAVPFLDQQVVIQQLQEDLADICLEVNDDALHDSKEMAASADGKTLLQNPNQDLQAFLGQAFDIAVIGGLLAFGIISLLRYDMQYMRGWEFEEIAAHLPYDSLHLYAVNVEGHPATTALLTSMTSYFFGDILAQVITDKAVPGRFDRLRTIRWASAGALVHSTLSSLYFPLSDVVADEFLGEGAGPLKLIFQIWIDNSIYFPVLTLALFVYLAITSGDNAQAGWNSFKTKLVPLGTRAWRFWPVADLLTFGPVPPQFRLLYVSSIRIVWVAIQSSFVTQQEKLEELKLQMKDQTMQEDLQEVEEKKSWFNIPKADSTEAFVAFSIYFLACASFCTAIFVQSLGSFEEELGALAASAAVLFQ